MDTAIALLSPEQLDVLKATADVLAGYGSTVIDLIGTTWNSIVIEDAIM